MLRVFAHNKKLLEKECDKVVKLKEKKHQRQILDYWTFVASSTKKSFIDSSSTANNINYQQYVQEYHPIPNIQEKKYQRYAGLGNAVESVLSTSDSFDSESDEQTTRNSYKLPKKVEIIDEILRTDNKVGEISENIETPYQKLITDEVLNSFRIKPVGHNTEYHNKKYLSSESYIKDDAEVLEPLYKYDFGKYEVEPRDQIATDFSIEQGEVGSFDRNLNLGISFNLASDTETDFGKTYESEADTNYGIRETSNTINNILQLEENQFNEDIEQNIYNFERNSGFDLGDQNMVDIINSYNFTSEIEGNDIKTNLGNSENNETTSLQQFQNRENEKSSKTDSNNDTFDPIYHKTITLENILDICARSKIELKSINLTEIPERFKHLALDHKGSLESQPGYNEILSLCDIYYMKKFSASTIITILERYYDSVLEKSQFSSSLHILNSTENENLIAESKSGLTGQSQFNQVEENTSLIQTPKNKRFEEYILKSARKNLTPNNVKFNKDFSDHSKVNNTNISVGSGDSDDTGRNIFLTPMNQLRKNTRNLDFEPPGESQDVFYTPLPSGNEKRAIATPSAKKFNMSNKKPVELYSTPVTHFKKESSNFVARSLADGFTLFRKSAVKKPSKLRNSHKISFVDEENSFTNISSPYFERQTTKQVSNLVDEKLRVSENTILSKDKPTIIDNEKNVSALKLDNLKYKNKEERRFMLLKSTNIYKRFLLKQSFNKIVEKAKEKKKKRISLATIGFDEISKKYHLSTSKTMEYIQKIYIIKENDSYKNTNKNTANLPNNSFDMDNELSNCYIHASEEFYNHNLMSRIFHQFVKKYNVKTAVQDIRTVFADSWHTTNTKRHILRSWAHKILITKELRLKNTR
ncbi:hypothetical protein BB558_003206 [Smittium angustum]|uniref:Uncharacterized protein n=1 Tax=Smittium angustum TaxID=133377 RepID=A0A2U1J6U0_SMIAN|nr:hypothetical protein BB558_003206 [Smittium angustum]